MGWVPPPKASTALRGALLALAAGRVARGAWREPPLGAVDGPPPFLVTVIVPARNEAERIGPCIDALVAAATGRGQVDVVVIDDGSTDDTREVAERAGARVVDAGPLPTGWAGKAHALQVGLEVADTPIVVAVDADVRVGPGAIRSLVERLTDHALVTAATRVDTPNPLGRLVHASMLASLVVRTGPPGVAPSRPSRAMANGQCMVLDRAAVLAAGGFAPVAGNLIEDVALARHLAGRGLPVAFVDGTRIVDVIGYGGPIATLRGWGRSLALADVSGPVRRTLDLGVVWVTLALPGPRLATGRGDAIDAAALGLRVGVAAATRGAFRQRGPALAFAPLADVVTAIALTAGTLRPSRVWKGRRY